MMKLLLVPVAAAAMLIGATGQAAAHVRIAESTPAAGSTVKNVRAINLTFSDTLDPAATVVEVVMTAMPGVANHGLMYIRNFTAAWSADNRKVTLTLRQPLRAGTYSIRWRSSGASDGHAMQGAVEFIVQ